MREAKYKKGGMVSMPIMVKSGTSEMIVEPRSNYDDVPGKAPFCYIEERIGIVESVETRQIDDRDPKFSYLVRLRYEKYVFDYLEKFDYTVWVDESYLSQPANSSSTRA